MLFNVLYISLLTLKRYSFSLCILVTTLLLCILPTYFYVRTSDSHTSRNSHFFVIQHILGAVYVKTYYW